MKRKNKRISIFGQVILGWIIGFLVAQPMFAQFGVAVVSDTSPTTIAQIQNQATQIGIQSNIAVDSKQSRIQDYLEYVKEAERWLDTVKHYSDVVIGNVRRFTSLKGIMGFVEQELGLSTDTLKALADVGELIRSVYALKNQFLSLIRTRLTMISNLERRAREGIFNPSADLQDLEDYLQNSIGRSAAATVATREKLAEYDDELELWTTQLQEVRAELAAKHKELKTVQQQLQNEGGLSTNPRQTGANEDGSPTQTSGGRNSMSSDGVSTLTIRAGQLEQQISDLKKRESELMDKIKQRYEEHHARFDNSYYTAKQWKATLDGWEVFSDTKKQETINMIDHYGEGGTVTAETPR
jgi:hypothetical protein